MIRYYNFEELVEYGKRQKDAHIVNDMPWSFSFYGVPVTHEADDKYIIGSSDVFFEKDDFLMVGMLGGVGIIKGGWILPQLKTSSKG